MTAASVLPARLTYEEFQSLPDDGQRHELIEGEHYVFATPSIEHQLVSLEVSGVFREAVTRRGLGWVMPAPVEVKFPGANAVQPDLVVVLRDRAHIVERARITGAPNVLLEILSPSTRTYDLRTKAELYARNGVPEYWIIDTFAETITVHELRDGKYVAHPNDGMARSLVIPDLVVDAHALFEAARFSV